MKRSTARREERQSVRESKRAALGVARGERLPDALGRSARGR